MRYAGAVDRAELQSAFLWQAEWAHKLGSPLYETLLRGIAVDVSNSGVCWRLLERSGLEARRSAPLQFLAAVHRLVLEGSPPELAQYYPSAGGTADLNAVGSAFLASVEHHGNDLAIPKTVQTNEVSRCCALLPGFLAIARITGLPLRLL